MKCYQIVVSGVQCVLFLVLLYWQQIYWIVVGVYVGWQKLIFDEYGNIEVFKGVLLVQLIWCNVDGYIVGVVDKLVIYVLCDGWKLMLFVCWMLQLGLELQSEVFVIVFDG